MPRVAELGLIQRPCLPAWCEGVLVRRELPHAEPSDHLLPTLRAERVDHRAGARQLLEPSVLRRARLVGGQPVEVLEDLRAQRRLYLVDLPPELVELLDLRVAVEVREELRDRLQQVRRLRVHPLARHDRQLLDRRDEHLQPLERSDRLRQVALGVVERLDVAADLLNHQLRRFRLRLDVPHLDEELAHRLLAHLDVLARGRARRRLCTHGLQDLLVQLLQLPLDTLRVRVNLRQRFLRREELVYVRNGVEVGRVERV
mmetsp:Transcript_38142/g.65400  ORF Transcript_38142/g.65400 Transcript_38142/m.65400 type:complete len:258 (-) Transcript_38142:127-900(-)